MQSGGPYPSCHLPESPAPPAGQPPTLGRPAGHLVTDGPTRQHSSQGDEQVAVGGYLCVGGGEVEEGAGGVPTL